jgi:predicted P-loop ATPase
MISLFKKHFDKQSSENLTVQNYIENIKNGRWQDIVLSIRAGKAKKDNAPAVTISGVFKERSAQKLIEHSGFICIDVDAKDQICTINIEAIKNDPYVYAVHKSIGGYGYAVLVKIDPNRHLDAFLALEQYFFVNFSIVVDKSCKDTSRLRYVSYDPDIYVNEKAKIFKKYLPKKEIKIIQQKPPIVVKSDFDAMVNQASSMNLFDDYQSYIHLAFALSSEFGQGGRVYFHQLCSSSLKYNTQKADKDYDKALSRNGTGITIATLYHIFKQAGISLTSERTETIKNIVKLADNPRELLAEMGIKDEDNLVAKLEKPAEKTQLDEIVDLIKINKIKFNEITRNFEISGQNMDDRMLAKFYASVWQKIDDSISKEKIWTLIMSKENTPSYNPIRDWFEENKGVIPDKEFEKLKACFKINPRLFVDGKDTYVDDYLDVYLKKWLLGVIGSAHGTYSLMILVLIGEQGTNKTEFFRNLLPEDLKKYYSESNLDEGKDSEILMCKKLLIVDDEFGGKSKKDATKLKRLSSQQTFSIRAPYGRISEDLNRLAVLGGTSNDPEVINDPTGNRRIIPINIIGFDIEKFKQIDKTKLFIELYNEWKNDKKGWFLNKHQIEWLNQINIKNMEVCVEDEILSGATDSPFAELTSTDIKVAIEMKYPSIKTTTKKIGMALKKLGFEQKLVRRGMDVKRVYQISLNFD